MLKFPCFEGWRLAFVRAFLAAAVGAAILGSCGGSSDSAPAANLVSGAIETPIVINLYPNQSAIAPPRLVVMATSVGSVPVSMPLIFDTGSAGVTVNADFSGSTIVGIGYFTTNSFFIDFGSGSEGWK